MNIDRQVTTTPFVPTPKINLYDGTKLLECGASVVFSVQIPLEVELNGTAPKDVEWELENLGFDGAKVNSFGGYIDFCEAIEREMLRVGIHSNCLLPNPIHLDTTDEAVSIIFYDQQYRFSMSPVRAIRALKSISTRITPTDFWPFITKFKPEDWIHTFMRSQKTGELVQNCHLDPEAIGLIVSKYMELTAHARKGFLKWAEGDYLSMYELAKRLEA